MNANRHSWWETWLAYTIQKAACFPFVLPLDNESMTSHAFLPHTLRIRCDSLTQASAPVVVGHYAQDAIVGAEAILDNSLQQRLSELANLGIYPSALGSHRCLFTPEQTPVGVIVMGLGAAGTLTVLGLQQAWLCTLLRYALHTQATKNATGQFTLSCLFVGAQSPDVGMDNAIEALLRALLAVQQRFRLALPEHPVPSFAIEWIEIDAYRALEASDTVLRLLPQAPFQGRFTLQQVVRALPSRLYALPVQSQENWWTRLLVPNHSSPETLPASMTQADQANPLMMVFEPNSQAATYDWEGLYGLQRGIVRQFTQQHYHRRQVQRAVKALLFCQQQSQASANLLAWQHLANEHERYHLRTVLPLAAEAVFCQLHHHAFELLHWQGSVQWNATQAEPTLTLSTGEICLADWQQVREPPSLLILALQYTTPIPRLAWLEWVHALLALGIQGLVINQLNVTASERDNFLLPVCQALQAGTSLGNAVWQARQKQAAAWQVWQCYGNPDYCLS